MERPLFGYLLAVCAAVALFLAWGERFSPLTQTTFGLSLRPNGSDVVINRISPNSEGARLGIQRGDILQISQISLSDRYRLLTGTSPAGATVTVPLLHGATRRIVTIAVAPGASPQGDLRLNGPTFLFSATLTLLVVAFIGLRRPSLATAALVWFGAGVVTTGNVIAQFSWLPNPIYGVVAVIINAGFGMLPGLALLPFIVRFPHAPKTERECKRARIADGILFAGIVAAVIQAIYEPLTFSTWGPYDSWSPPIYALIVLIFAILGYRDAAGEERRRIGWVLTGFVITAVSFAMFNTANTDFVTVNDWWALGVMLTTQCLETALPLALAYAVLRHRVLDIGFVLNRTAIYAVMTTLVVAFVGFIDWLATRFIGEQHVAMAIEALMTIAFGFGLNWMHGRLEGLLDRVIFRQRYVAETRINYRIEAFAFAESIAAIDEGLASDAAQILNLSSAAVFGRLSQTAQFRRSAATGWTTQDASSLDPDSLIIRTLRAIERPLFLDDAALMPAGFPEGVGRPILAIPILVQHELTGLVLYGNHRDGASPDPEEVSLLARLTASAANAYGAVEARQWRERAHTLEESIRSLSAAPSPG
ncbi:MAG: GAF domain-containing protein [Vulcanimicrobiaceae bacterium]|jgi:hypothetical protein